MVGVPKLALDFLLQRATMTLRQRLRYRAFLQDRENLLGDGNTIAEREGPVWRWYSRALAAVR